MSTETFHVSRRMVALGLCIAMLLTCSLILAPVVGAASETNKTEIKMTDTNNIASDETELLTQRASIIDEAMKEAQEVVSEQLASRSASQTDEEPTDAAEPDTEPQSASSSSYDDEDDYYFEYYSDDYSQSESSSSNSGSDYSGSNTVSASYSDGYLLSIANPDPGYVGYSVSLSDSDRDAVERMLMGEAGSMGFDGMALVAQCIRDTYVSGSYSSMMQLFDQNGYYGSMYITPSSTCKEVVNYIFDQGNSAVQHSIRVFYASDICSSPWHEAQEFVVSYGYVRFFDF